ncbi:hypothetical protein J5583_00480 [Streptococcus suis]|uniref:hypothetical protein n=1 Tax=Streptococcus suis TaxID=1307 RepID=UPI001ABE72CC|nr:hypothetical protein [Streptococcus suis]MBO4108667.1 hypothetical protein [Streptococcus suis]
MADLQKLPVQSTEVFGPECWVTPTYVERVPTGRTMFEPFRVFKVSGEKQQDVEVRVTGLEHSDIPTKLSKATFTGLEMGVGSVESRGKTKRVIVFSAKKMRVSK